MVQVITAILLKITKIQVLFTVKTSFMALDLLSIHTTDNYLYNAAEMWFLQAGQLRVVHPVTGVE